MGKLPGLQIIGKNYGFLKFKSDSRFNQFDHKFFGISDSEVEQMDPQQKQLLQCVYRALEDAGIPMENASGTRTGVFFGTVSDQIQACVIFIQVNIVLLLLQ